MIEILYKKIFKFFDKNQIPLLVFFSSLFIFISFAGTRLFFSDEGVILDQFYNLINGSLALKAAKIDTAKGIFITVGNNLYGKFSYSLLILSLPTYYILKTIDYLYGAHLFMLQLWALSGGVVVYLIAKTLNLKRAAAGGAISYFILITTNLYFFKPIYFPKWGEILSIEFTNILITSFMVVIVYLLFKDFFSYKIALFASFFVIFATPIPFYAITLKHHSLAVFLTLLTFYFFYKYYEKKDNKFIYLAYISAGLCIWTRFLDGAVLLASLLITDIVVFRRGIKYIISISLIILVSLLPFFSFNYLILGNPFSIIESTPLTDKPVTLFTAKDFISLEENPAHPRQNELLDKLGYKWSGKIRGDWFEILGYSMFFKLLNTFGIFLVSPFLIIALAFIIDRVKWKNRLNVMDKFFGSYAIMLIGMYIILDIILNVKPLISIITDTPVVLEYRYLLILYVILLYFALRIDKVRQLIENNSKRIVSLYGIILLVTLIYFITGFPVPFLNIYYVVALITSFSLLLSITLLIMKKRSSTVSLDKLLTLMIALSFALASFLLLFYYWVVSMTYISPSQNYNISPILEIMIKWMHEIIL